MADFEVSGTASLNPDRMLESVDSIIDRLDKLMEKLSELDDRIDEMEEKEIRIDVVIKNQDRLEELVVFLDDIDHNTYTVDVKINIEGGDRLDLLRVSLVEISTASHRIDVSVNTENFDEAAVRIAALNLQLDELSRNERRAADAGSGFQFSLAMLAPLLIPASAAVLSLVGAAGGLASAFGTMVAPLGLALYGTKQLYTSISTLYAGLSATTQAALLNASTYDQMYAILDKGSSAFRNSNSLMREAIIGFATLKQEVSQFESAIKDNALMVLINFFRLLITSMSELIDPANEAAGAMAKLIADFTDRLSDPTFQKFFDNMDANIGTLVTDWGTGVLNIIEGITAILNAFFPLGLQISGGFVQMTEKFDIWAQHLADSEGFKKFVGTVETDGPLIAKIIGNIALLFAHLVGALGESKVNGGFLNDLLKLLQTLNKFTGTHEGLTQLSADLGLVAIAAWKLGPALGPIASFLASPAGLAVLAIAALAVGFTDLYNNSQTFKNYVDTNLKPSMNSLGGTVSGLSNTFVSIWPSIERAWQLYGKNLENIVTDTWHGIVLIIQGIVEVIEGVAQTFLGTITGNFSEAWGGIEKIAGGTWKILEGIFGTAIKIIGNLLAIGWTLIATDATSAWHSITTDMSSWAGKIENAVTEMFGNMVGAAWTGMKDFLVAMILESGSIETWFQNLPGEMIKWLGSLGGVLIGAGENLIIGLINGIENQVGNLESYLGSITDILPDWKGPAARDAMILYESGQLVMQGFIDGAESKYTSVASSFDKFTNSLGGNMAKQLTTDVTARLKAAVDTSAGVSGSMGAGGYGNGGMNSQVTFGPGSININNPLPEQPSTSLTRTMQVVSRMGTIQTPYDFHATA